LIIDIADNVNVNFEAMREEIDKIFEAYEKDCISKSEMKEQLLNLHSVSHSYYQVVHDCFDGDMAAVTGGLKTLEEAKQALEDNKKHIDLPMYVIAKINCG